MNTGDTARVNLVGGRLGAFRVDRPLGEGGMGAVYFGQDVALERPVAIKVLHAKLARDSEFVERFVREARTAARLHHPNIVAVYGAGYEDGIAYMALELVEGCTLFELYRNHRPFPAQRACSLIQDVAKGLAVAHEQDVVHRDIKPENILVSNKGVPKLADFGLARSSDQRITETGVFLGTPQYASPEQCNAAELTPASDLYSLGVVLYELLAGRPPYEAPTPLTLFKKILLEPPVPLSDRCPDLPPSLHAIVARLLEKDPARRYQYAAELVTDLGKVIAVLPDAEEGTDPFDDLDEHTLMGAGVVTQFERATDSGPHPTPFEDSVVGSIALPSKSAARELAAAATEATPLPATAPALEGVSGSPAPEGVDPTLQLRSLARFFVGLAAVLLLSLGLLVAFGNKASDTRQDPEQAAARGPQRVVVVGWTNQVPNNDEFTWLEDAIPEFVRTSLSEHSPHIVLVSPIEQTKAVAQIEGFDPSKPDHRAKLRELLKADLVVSGHFLSPGGQEMVSVGWSVEDAQGEQPKLAVEGGRQSTFAKNTVLTVLQSLSKRLALGLRNYASPLPLAEPRALPEKVESGPTSTTSVVAALPSAPQADPAEREDRQVADQISKEAERTAPAKKLKSKLATLSEAEAKNAVSGEKDAEGLSAGGASARPSGSQPSAQPGSNAAPAETQAKSESRPRRRRGERKAPRTEDKGMNRFGTDTSAAGGPDGNSAGSPVDDLDGTKQETSKADDKTKAGEAGSTPASPSKPAPPAPAKSEGTPPKEAPKAEVGAPRPQGATTAPKTSALVLEARKLQKQGEVFKLMSLSQKVKACDAKDAKDLLEVYSKLESSAPPLRAVCKELRSKIAK